MARINYRQTLNLTHYQTAAYIDQLSGEIVEVPYTQKPNNLPSGKVVQKYDDFNKINTKAIKFLETVLTNEELGIVFKMIGKADYDSNIMMPLNDDLSYRELATEFGIGKNRVDTIFTKLFSLGVYAQVKVANGPYSEYWTLNPFISWKGKFIDKSISSFFNMTIIARSICY